MPRFRIALLVTAILTGCTATRAPLPVVPHVDLARYAGRWYEIASFPMRFQRGCVATQAVYTAAGDGVVRVENSCRDGAFDGAERRIEGTAAVVDPETNAKLAVTFFWPFRGDYWIIALDPEYRWAVVGHPSRDYLWILSRSRTLDAETYERLVAEARGLGFPVERLTRTPQPAE